MIRRGRLFFVERSAKRLLIFSLDDIFRLSSEKLDSEVHALHTLKTASRVSPVYSANHSFSTFLNNRVAFGTSNLLLLIAFCHP